MDETRGTRGRLLTGVVVVGAGAVGAGLVAGLPDYTAAASAAQDADILNFALGLEEVEAALFTAGARRGALDGELAQFARVVGAHERAHVAFLRRTLGGKARPRPPVHLGDTPDDPQLFVRTAIVLEDAAVAAYNGQGPNLTRAALRLAAPIVSVEARHAAWIRDVGGRLPAPVAADRPDTIQQVTAVLAQTGLLTEGG
jgi:hypothetical protein